MERLGIVALLFAALGAPAELASRAGAQEHRAAKASFALPADVVVMADGKRHEGLIESETAAWVYLAQVFRPAGRSRYVVIRPIERSRIDEMIRLEPADRARLRRDLESFVHRARIEAGKMDALEIGFVEQAGGRFRHYRGEWFSLDSATDETTTRRVIVRVEQIFTAYRQIVPPRRESDRPLRIVLYGSLDRYREHLQRLGLALENPSCFVPGENLLLAACEVDKYRDALAQVDREHAQLRADLQSLEIRLADRLKELGQVLQQSAGSRSDKVQLIRRERVRLEQAIGEKREEIRRCDRENARAFEQVTGQMFVRLYHEALHAYLENYVYPASEYDVPLWLNEGLATVFERGQLEDDVLRFDAPNQPALKRLQADLRGQTSLSLAELLSADPSAFLESHGSLSEQAARYYATAWGLAYYLIYQRDLLGPQRLDAYLAPAQGTLPPVERFEALVGQPLPEFEDEWREYVSGLR